ncbi:hypothetical protein BDZ85DRAFT_313695 [Elsinoe ampelina]|uniref:Uncharacterized protein n=1 Tax=Elsinoe ampelina TaxID=302913 RepID=A0A6A6GAN2_9PEZI|nr:hypothetical protein BDZ85DRAFT_313695 [Elsinoe ampelina]
MADRINSEYVGLVQEVFNASQVIAVTVAQTERSPFLGGIGTKLHLAAVDETLQRALLLPSYGGVVQSAIIELSRMAKLPRAPIKAGTDQALPLESLRRLATWMNGHNRGSIEFRRALEQFNRVIPASLRVRFDTPSTDLERYLNAINRATPTTDDVIESQEVPADLEDYANDLNDHLFHLLHDPAACICTIPIRRTAHI